MEGNYCGLFKVLSRHLSGETEKNYEKQNSRSSGQYLSPAPPKYEAGVLTTRPLRSNIPPSYAFILCALCEDHVKWIKFNQT
jgi:hypothetical protein